MAENSSIEWTDHTFNPWRGCTKVSDGCANCYAESMSRRNPGVLGIWGPRGSRETASEDQWRKPIKWNREAEQTGERRRVFCASLADVFEGQDTMPAQAWPEVQAARERLWGVIETTPMLDWLVLTKRPQNVPSHAPDRWAAGWPANLWLGTSVEDHRVTHRIDQLRDTPARLRFLSIEPLIGPLPKLDLTGIHWVIVGGESGGSARPMEAEWVRDLRDQCTNAGVAFFFKQWGKTQNNPDLTDVTIKGRNPDGAAKGGRALDGQVWHQFPVSPAEVEQAA